MNFYLFEHDLWCVINKYDGNQMGRVEEITQKMWFGRAIWETVTRRNEEREVMRP